MTGNVGDPLGRESRTIARVAARFGKRRHPNHPTWLPEA